MVINFEQALDLDESSDSALIFVQGATFFSRTFSDPTDGIG